MVNVKSALIARASLDLNMGGSSYTPPATWYVMLFGYDWTTAVGGSEIHWNGSFQGFPAFRQFAVNAFPDQDGGGYWSSSGSVLGEIPNDTAHWEVTTVNSVTTAKNKLEVSFGTAFIGGSGTYHVKAFALLAEFGPSGKYQYASKLTPEFAVHDRDVVVIPAGGLVITED